MFATLQFVADGDRLLRLNFLPFSVVNAITHAGIEILASRIQQMEDGLGLFIAQHFLRQINTQCLFAVTEWQGEFAMMGLTGRIGDIGTDHKSIKHRMTGLWQIERHLGLKLTFCVGHGFTLIYLYPVMTIA